MLRHYCCNRYKSYSIRNHYFKNGLFETDDPDVQRLIETADGYGVFIHPVETAEEIATMKAIEEKAAQELGLPQEEEGPIATQGARSTVSDKGMRKGQLIGAKKK